MRSTPCPCGCGRAYPVSSGQLDWVRYMNSNEWTVAKVLGCSLDYALHILQVERGY